MEFADILSVFKLDVMQFAETISQCMKLQGVGDVTGKVSSDWAWTGCSLWVFANTASVGVVSITNLYWMHPPLSDSNQQQVLPTTQKGNIKIYDCGIEITLIIVLKKNSFGNFFFSRQPCTFDKLNSILSRERLSNLFLKISLYNFLMIFDFSFPLYNCTLTMNLQWCEQKVWHVWIKFDTLRSSHRGVALDADWATVTSGMPDPPKLSFSRGRPS